MRNIKVSDYSLRELGETKSLLFREKVALVSNIDNYGVDAIELAPIIKYKEDSIIYKTISSIVKNSEICIPVGFDEDKIEDVFECIKEATHPCLQIEVPVSTVTMEYTYHIKADKMLIKVGSLCKKAKEYCDTIEFVALDATRSDVDFLISIIKIAKENGATSATICDDAGVYTPKQFETLVKNIKEQCDIKLNVKVSDELNMAYATALYAIEAGVDGIKTSITGNNSLKTDKIANVLYSQKDNLDISLNLKTTELKSDISQLLKTVKRDESTNSNNTNTQDILLDSNSTVSDIALSSKKLGYDLSEQDIEKIRKSLISVLDKKPTVGSKEFEAIIASVAQEVPSTYHLESYNISLSNVTTSMSNVVLKKDDENITGIATGDGPIDASFYAIEQCIGHHYELDDFQIQSVTEGKEALGSAVVRLRYEGKLYSGTGLSADIVGASIRAYINALNKIVYEEGLS